MYEDTPVNDEILNNTLIVIQRKAKRLMLSQATVQTIRRLLVPIYAEKNWQAYFGQGMRDAIYPAIDSTSASSSSMLNRMADTIVHLGGQMVDGKNR